MADNYNSIFGTEEPKFISGVNEVDLDNCVILKDEADVLNIEHKDIVNGNREWSRKGKHWIFEVDVYITKHANPETSYNTLKAYEHEIVTLYRRRDGSPFINNNDEEIEFFIESIDEIYLKHYLYADILRFRFISVNPVDIPLTTTVQDSEIPQTVLEIYGENWNGTTMSGHIGGAVTETGSVVGSTDSTINNKKNMRCTLNSYLTLTEFDETAGDYVIFTVHKLSTELGNYSATAIDFYNDTTTEGNLRITAWSSIGDTNNEPYYAGWDFGGSPRTIVAENLQADGEDARKYHIRVWLLEKGNIGKFFLDGGAALITAGWESRALGGSSQRRKIGATSSSVNKFQYIAHLSMHKVTSGATVNRAWINNYGQALADYYNLTWTDLIE